MLRVLRGDEGSFPLLIMSTSVRKVMPRTEHVLSVGRARDVGHAEIFSVVSYVSFALFPRMAAHLIV